MASKRSSVKRTSIPFHRSSTAKAASHQVLIVEDEILLAREIEAHLMDLGYGITAIALSASDAIAILQSQPVDIVLMDIVLKGEMDGISAAAYVRQEFHLPVVYLTAYSDVYMVSQAAFTCPSGYLMKPCTTTDLQITLEIALAQHQLEDNLRQALIQAERLTTIDQVTGILTAPRLLTMAEKEFHRASRYQHPFAVVMLTTAPMGEDVPMRGLHEPGINDRFLSTVAHTVQNCLRQADYLGHLENEGLGLILPETDARSATTVAERIQQTLAQLPLNSAEINAPSPSWVDPDSPSLDVYKANDKQRNIRLSANIGVAAWDPLDSDFMDVIQRAENALVTARQQGSNSIVVRPLSSKEND